MSTENLQTEAFYDLAKLGQLKTRARANTPESIKEVARQFESIFVKMMLKSMRDASEGDPLLDSDSTKMYQDMYDDQMATSLTKQHSIGLADMLERQLTQIASANEKAKSGKFSPKNKSFPIHEKTELKHFELHKPEQAFEIDHQQQRAFDVPKRTHSNSEMLLPVVPTLDETKPVAVQPTEGKTIEIQPSVTAVPNVVSDSNTFSGDPEEFVTKLWPLAKTAAEQLGVSPQVLLAQAALETGWGRAVTTREDGSSSFNLFNIKADQRWNGDRVAKTTLEYQNGFANKEQASFRAYDSFAQSFGDYVTFLKENQRYQQALRNNHEPFQFVNELQQAGYATDPNYASKIMRIIKGDPLNSALDKLKLSGVETLTKTGT